MATSGGTCVATLVAASPRHCSLSLAALQCVGFLLPCPAALQGYVVLAVEHTDGSASAVRLPGGEWRLYGGLGDEEAQARGCSNKEQGSRPAVRACWWASEQ